MTYASRDEAWAGMVEVYVKAAVERYGNAIPPAEIQHIANVVRVRVNTVRRVYEQLGGPPQGHGYSSGTTAGRRPHW